ncbi:MAG: hypothetical protein LBR80_19065 [Deltaproteobacteria bacterium]|nr:hypothetical protein [Deltaproteobacteria bacterium]
MARSDLVKKLFNNFKIDDRDGFVKAANEIIDDELKKNHVNLANDLRKIISNSITSAPRTMLSLMKADSDITGHETSLFDVIYPMATT